MPYDSLMVNNLKSSNYYSANLTDNSNYMALYSPWNTFQIMKWKENLYSLFSLCFELRRNEKVSTDLYHHHAIIYKSLSEM